MRTITYTHFGRVAKDAVGCASPFRPTAELAEPDGSGNEFDGDEGEVVVDCGVAEPP